MPLSENPNLALIPSGYKSRKIYSVLPTSGVGDFDFSRSGTATRINSQGLIETVGDNVPRLNYPLIDGKVVGCPSHLLENSSTNLYPYSEYFISGSSWSAANLNRTTDSVISPNGKLNGTKIEAIGNGGHPLYDDLSIANGTYTVSLFLKKGANTSKASLSDGYSTTNVSFDLDSATITANTVQTLSPFIEAYNDGWYRLGYTFVVYAGQTQPALYLYDSNGNQSYQGNGETMYVFGAQLEQQSHSTSYIKSNGSATTRSAETANGAGDASTFNSSEGVLMAEISALDDVGGKWIALSNGTTNERLSIALQGDTVRVFIKNTSGTIWDYSVSAFVFNFNKIAVKFKSSDYALWINGIEIQTSTNANIVANLNSLQFDSGGGASNFYGNTKQIQYFDSALNDSDLEKLTSWVSFTDMANGQLYTIE